MGYKFILLTSHKSRNQRTSTRLLDRTVGGQWSDKRMKNAYPRKIVVRKGKVLTTMFRKITSCLAMILRKQVGVFLQPLTSFWFLSTMLTQPYILFPECTQFMTLQYVWFRTKTKNKKQTNKQIHKNVQTITYVRLLHSKYRRYETLCTNNRQVPLCKIVYSNI